jgi:hypothetical protein
MAFFTINYSGKDKTLKYKSIELHSSKGEMHLFDTGDVIKDWFDMMKHLILNMNDEPYLTHSSTVDHFFMDGGDELADSAYLFDGELKYPKGIFDEGIEILVPKGTKPTWSELKSLIN